MDNEEMIQRFLVNRDITDRNVIEAFRRVDRKYFVPEKFKDDAYVDSPIPIGEGQTNSQPYIIAKMLQELEIRKEHKVLEVGFGCGYVTAILSFLAKKVIATEVHEIFLNSAMKNLKQVGAHNVEFHITKNELGYSKESPYDRIIVNAAAPYIPRTLIIQLKNNGIMVIPVGEPYMQVLVKVRRVSNKIVTEDICGCAFVPLILPKKEKAWK